MFLVVELNQDEFGRGNSRPIHKFDSSIKMRQFVRTYRGDISRLEVYDATPLAIEVEIK